jgi:hypothetical protein
MCISRLTTQQAIGVWLFSFLFFLSCCLASCVLSMPRRLVAVDRVWATRRTTFNAQSVLWSDVVRATVACFDRSGMFVPSMCLPVGPSIDRKLATINLNVDVVALLNHTPCDPGRHGTLRTNVVGIVRSLPSLPGTSEVPTDACHDEE